MPKSKLLETVQVHQEYSETYKNSPHFKELHLLAARFQQELTLAYQGKVGDEYQGKKSPIRVIIGGSFPYKMVALSLGYTSTLPHRDYDFYESHMYLNDETQFLFEQHRTQACALISESFSKKGAVVRANTDPLHGFLNVNLENNDYTMQYRQNSSNRMPFEVFSNFQIGLCPFSGVTMFDKTLDLYKDEDRHFKDFQLFLNNGVIISYHLDKLITGAIAPATSVNHDLHKLAYVLKSYLEPLQEGRHFDGGTARYLKRLFENEQLVNLLRERLFSAYGPSSQNRRFSSVDDVNAYFLTLLTHVDSSLQEANQLGPRLMSAEQQLTEAQHTIKELNRRLTESGQIYQNLLNFRAAENAQRESASARMCLAYDQSLSTIKEQAQEIERLSRLLDQEINGSKAVSSAYSYPRNTGK